MSQATIETDPERKLEHDRDELAERIERIDEHIDAARRAAHDAPSGAWEGADEEIDDSDAGDEGSLDDPDELDPDDLDELDDTDADDE